MYKMNTKYKMVTNEKHTTEYIKRNHEYTK